MTKAVTEKRQAGDDYEDQAVQFLTTQGLKLLARNYQCKAGEIDLIMDHAGTIVFVEVRYRKSQRFGGAAMSVTPAKQRKVALAALHYLQREKRNNDPCRFDVIAFSANEQQWLQDAFYSPL
jgi:putative endonuclease